MLPVLGWIAAAALRKEVLVAAVPLFAVAALYVVLATSTLYILLKAVPVLSIAYKLEQYAGAVCACADREKLGAIKPIVGNKQAKPICLPTRYLCDQMSVVLTVARSSLGRDNRKDFIAIRSNTLNNFDWICTYDQIGRKR